MTKRYLLVCEGPTDISILEAIAHSLGGGIIELAPKQDATTATYPSHGWKAVRDWCQRIGANSSKNPLEFYLKWHQADGLIIQIDTDIAHFIKIGKKYGASGDSSWCSKAIDNWLGVHHGLAFVHYVLPTYSTESWILATFANSRIGISGTRDYESIATPEKYLMSLGYQTVNGKLKKNRQLYKGERYSQRVLKHICKAKRRCSSLNNYVLLFK